MIPDRDLVIEEQRRRADDALAQRMRSQRMMTRVTIAVLALLWGVVGAALFSAAAHGAVPEACRKYEREITRQAHNTFGIVDAPIAMLGAQMQQESSCNPKAKSPFASGLTQFTPGTAADLAARYPTQLGAADPLNEQWAIAAQALYMRDLMAATPGATACDTMAFGLSGYNGGAGWLARDRAVCARTSPCDADRWFDNVANTPDKRRAPQYIAENRGYPQRILLVLMPDYVRADYPGGSLFCGVRAGSTTSAPSKETNP